MDELLEQLKALGFSDRECAAVRERYEADETLMPRLYDGVLRELRK